MKIWIAGLILIFSSLVVIGQDRCPPESLALDRIEEFENWLREIRQKRLSPEGEDGPAVYLIPVVVHVIHNGEPEGVGTNVSDAIILEQIQILNDDFRRQNADAVNTPTEFLAVAADTEIEFVLARQDPNGLPTDGIVRVQGSLSDYSYGQRGILFNESQWNTENYLNIYVTTLRGAIGFAAYPQTTLPGLTPETNPALDAMAVDYRYFGVRSNSGEFDFDSYGRTLVHEVGHYLGLRHIWGDSNSCGVDDFCADTPESNGDNGGYGSPCSYPNPLDDSECAGGPDMFQNYMDYTDDICMNLFTQCQRGRMRTVLENSPRRLSLLTSPGLITPIVLDRDLRLISLVRPPVVSCAAPQEIQIRVQNVGNNTVTSYELRQEFNSVVYTATVNTNLTIGQSEDILITVPGNAQSGINSYILEISSINGQSDEDPEDSRLDNSFINDEEILFFPYLEDFDARSWISAGEGAASAWTEFMDGGNTSLEYPAFETPSLYRSWLVSPILNTEGNTELAIFFDMAYARSGVSDLLEIYASTDCGASYELVRAYELSTLVDFPESTSELQSPSVWVEQFVNLSAYAGQDVRVAFVFTSNGGNNFFLDNVEFVNNDDPDQPRLANTFAVYPNPTTASGEIQVTLNLPKIQDLRIELRDIQGKLVDSYHYPRGLNQTFTLPISGLSGMYFLRVIGPEFDQVRRILISR